VTLTRPRIVVRAVLAALIGALLSLTGAAARDVRLVLVGMPADWIPHLQPILDTLSGPDESWIGVASDDSDVTIRSLDEGPGDFAVIMLAAVVASDAPLIDIRHETLIALMRDGRSPNLPGWTAAVSREARDLPGLEAAAALTTGHAEALAAALANRQTIGVVRWQTPGWPANLRPLRIDGLYPAEVAWYGAVEGGADAAPLADRLREALQDWGAPPVEIAAVGDIMLGRSLAAAVAHTGDQGFPTRLVAAMLTGADLAIGNLECVLSERGTPAQKRYTFRAAPSAVEALTLAGFDVLSLANNHAMDFGGEALLDTIATLSAAGIAHVGAGADSNAAHAPAFVTRGGLRFALLGYVDVPNDSSSSFRTIDTVAGPGSPGVAWADPARIAADVASARAEAVAVIVLLHSGYEYQETPNAIQRAAARAAIDAGAAAVIGAHPHVLQGVEHYRGGLIAYSLGNFVFDMTVTQSALLRLWIAADGVRAHAWEPVIIATGGQPRPAPPATAAEIYNTLNRLMRALNR
jgi:poly-gamma-glutamate synthesis protein (capsule biosynthesis protein)